MNEQDCAKNIMNWFILKANNACWKLSLMTRNAW